MDIGLLNAGDLQVLLPFRMVNCPTLILFRKLQNSNLMYTPDQKRILAIGDNVVVVINAVDFKEIGRGSFIRVRSDSLCAISRWKNSGYQ